MSRPVAGVRNKTLILTLPGSPKGAKENLEAVLPLLPHACLQARGGDSRSLHVGGVKRLEEDAGVGVAAVAEGVSQPHRHHHDRSHQPGPGHAIPRSHTKPSERPHESNDPSAGPTRRYRASPYPMLSVEDALSRIISQTPGPTSITVPVDLSLIGSVLAADVVSAEAVPAYRASIVDGYALTVNADSSTKGTFPVASVSHAQASSMPPPLRAGTIARITTGAPLPPNANSVVMVEDTVLASSTSDGSEEETVEILTAEVKAGENIREPGSDIVLNSIILRAGTLVTAVGGEIGLLAASGTRTVSIYKRPLVGVLSTGDELVEYNVPESLTGGQIRDSNRPSLLSALHSWGFTDTVDLGVARDTPPEALEAALRNALRRGCDIIISTGGVSMGELDLLKPTIERRLSGTVHFGRVSMKPGKPTTFASIPFKDDKGQRSEKLIFSLPGNPASALVTAHLFVLPSLQKAVGMQGPNKTYGLPKVKVALEHEIRMDPVRTEYHRAIVRAGEQGVLLASSTGGQRSSRVGSLAGANALLVLPTREGNLRAGETVEALMMGPIVGY